MKTAKQLASYATAAKRTSAGIRSFISNSPTTELKPKERNLLARAAQLLEEKGRGFAALAREKAKNEAERVEAIERAARESKQIMAAWPAATVLDKVALIIGYHGEHRLRVSLNNIEKGYSRYLEEQYEEAICEISRSAAWRSIDSGKPIEELLAGAAAKLVDIKNLPVTKELVYCATREFELMRSSSAVDPTRAVAGS